MAAMVRDPVRRAALAAANAVPIPTRQPIKRTWHMFDARNQIVGHLASRIAPLLLGKNKPTFRPNLDRGDTVVVLNAEHIKFSGRKEQQKIYYHHSGYPGGLKKRPVWDVRAKQPHRILRHAVNGMIPKDKLKLARMDRLKIYTGTEHSHRAQFPFEIKTLPDPSRKPTPQELADQLNAANALVPAYDLRQTVYMPGVGMVPLPGAQPFKHPVVVPETKSYKELRNPKTHKRSQPKSPTWKPPHIRIQEMGKGKVDAIKADLVKREQKFLAERKAAGLPIESNAPVETYEQLQIGIPRKKKLGGDKRVITVGTRSTGNKKRAKK